MKLTTRIGLNLSLAMVPVLALWAALFYFAMVDEINDEADDALELVADRLVVMVLAGEELPPKSSIASNNSYTLRRVDDAYASTHPHIRFEDADFYIAEKEELEPARVLTTLFRAPDAGWYELRVATPTFERADLKETILYWVIFLSLLLLVVGVAVTMFVFRRGMAPLYRLLRWVDNYTPGHAVEPVPSGCDITEFCRLSEAADQMAHRAELLYDRQKQFVGNASHELQTPLAVLGNRIEWMLGHFELSEEQMTELYRLLQTQRHLVRLNRDLLLLTKIDNRQVPESSEVDLVALVRREQELLGEIYEEQQIGCRMELPPHFTVRMNESLASVLVSNLLRNAYIHSEPQAEVEVICRAGELEISNTGSEPLDAERIFERFYRHTKREGSTGLGLALVKAICNHYHIDIAYRFERQRHCFRLRF